MGETSGEDENQKVPQVKEKVLQNKGKRNLSAVEDLNFISKEVRAQHKRCRTELLPQIHDMTNHIELDMNLTEQSNLDVVEGIENRQNISGENLISVSNSNSRKDVSTLSRRVLSQRIRREREKAEEVAFFHNSTVDNFSDTPTAITADHLDGLTINLTEENHDNVVEELVNVDVGMINQEITPENLISVRNSGNDVSTLSRRVLGQRKRRDREKAEAAEALLHGSANSTVDDCPDTTSTNIETNTISSTISGRAMAQRKRRRRERLQRLATSTADNASTSSAVPEISNQEGNEEMTVTELCEENSYEQPIEEIDDEQDDDEDLYVGPDDDGFEGNFSEKLHYLGEMNVECPDCKALHWIDERLTKSTISSPLFGKCCLQGQIRLPQLRTPPSALKVLYDGNDNFARSFRDGIRQYNTANAFTSLGYKGRRKFTGKGPSSFIIHGELRHLSGSLLPEPEKEPCYSQIYIYDPDSALDIRKERNPNLQREVLKIIQDTLQAHNPFIKLYRQAYQILSREDAPNKNIAASLQYTANKDRRRYNEPTANEIAVIIPGDGTEVCGNRDIILHLRGNGLKRIDECHPAYLPLHYVLLFPYGELGWEEGLKKWDTKHNREGKNRVTQMDFYSYRIFERRTEYSTILRAGKLFQEFLVDAWAATEQNRLTFCKLSQKDLRSDLYKNLTDIEKEALRPDQVGKQVILPSSFTGGPRYMHEIYQDSMAITRRYKHPDIFLTMTTNPNWKEIREALLEHQSPIDRPDIVARVFELKRKALIDEITNKKVFGRVDGYVYTIEFQKRGLPHMHALIFLNDQDKIRTAAQIDRLILAEFPDEVEHPELFATVKRHMIHGPCGTRCLENDKCTKRFPKDYAECTSMNRDGYPTYRRRNTGRTYNKGKYIVDNKDVVPYSPYLLEMFDCHINVEVCAGIRAVKYIHKYIYKGHDRATLVLKGGDEIQQYLDSRYIGPPEAAWRIFGHRLHNEDPPVLRLALHLEGMHHVVFHSQKSSESVQETAKIKKSSLMAFFDRCEEDEGARAYTYLEFPEHYVWNKTPQVWTKRVRGRQIGRIYFASPNSGERFYLRMLLTIVKGPRSFKHLRTVDGIEYETFKAACLARGLLEDDEEWVQCLREAATMKTGHQLRSLFSIILTECNPSQPELLWDQFAKDICDDVPYKLQVMLQTKEPAQEEVVRDYGLYLLEQLLQESGHSLAEYPPMPQPKEDWNKIKGNRLVWEHRQLQCSIRAEEVQQNVERLNDEQLLAYEEITNSVFEDKGTTFFLNGGAGTGKTFVYNTVAAKCRSLNYIVVTVASSGIASLLLVGGRTAHSTFCIPLDILDDSVCGFNKQSVHAELFRQTKLIIWDEVPMQHRYCVEAVDRALQDIHNNDRPFGGITVVLGGDFRQILPVIPRGVREQVVGASLRRSPLWSIIRVLKLKQNMRLRSDDPANVEFAEFLLKVGTDANQYIQLPPTMKRCESLEDLISSIYPEDKMTGAMSPEFLTERTILSARNEDVSVINSKVLGLLTGERHTYLGADKMQEKEGNSMADTSNYPTEYLNTLDPPGLPPFKLELKAGCPVMLLRNIAQKEGLCNGTRLMIVRCGSHVIEAKILTGDKAGNLVFIPRISLSPTSAEIPVQMTRRQYPIRLAYAMTINKSQGQSVQYVGIDLRTSVFSHGQLYVALSRCTSFDRIRVLLPEDEFETTENIVYPEVLL